MKKIKILYIGLSPNLGGIETYLYNLYKNMDKSKFEVSFLVFKGKKVCFYDELKAEGVKFFEITHRNKNYRQFLKDLKEVYSNNEFDYIHQNLMNLSCFERITYAHKYSNAKIIIHSHTSGHGKDIELKTRVLHQIGKFKTRKISYIRFACSDAAGKMMFGKKSFTVLLNGIDVNKFQYNQFSRAEIRNEFQIKDNTYLIGSVGAFEPVKNHDFLLQVFYEFKKNNSNSKLILVGEGKLREYLTEKTKQLNIESDVIFLGKRKDVNKIYSAFDAYIMPSLYEGISIALLEAQTNGLKCYVSNTIDKNTDITGNVDFISLKNNAKFWASCIDVKFSRDKNVLKKIPNEFNLEKSCDRVYKYYISNKSE